MAIFTIVWILVLAGTIIIFEFIVPLQIARGLLNGLVQGILSLFLVLVWLGIFVFMRNRLVRKQLSNGKDK